MCTGETERERLHAAVPLRRVLLVLEAEGAGVQEHCVDRRMRGAAPQGQN